MAIEGAAAEAVRAVVDRQERSPTTEYPPATAFWASLQNLRGQIS
jgi:hypothetical protein